MAKQLNVSLAFTADTGKAKAQLQDLQNSLDKLINSTSTNTSNFGLTKELAQATTEASKLKIMLESATNSTGGLDLGKFNQNLKQSGMELKDYAEILSSLGPEGSKAFAKLAQSITTANVPLKQTNKLLDEFATTMKNTVRWQFSSSMLHGFMGAVSGALGYAKDLDKSLNDIRIVTGYNTDQMAKFAEEANRAAKALSSTTTDYTNASLIYYQQGLDEDEIVKRTEVTMKMANAAGVSAQTVSDQMTAVWNNFDDGSKSLEYYADVMTALGAATASSTDEISAGLNKFAAVAETVGLSYEYATAALATVTSTTRESADVVGTAFKTLFARIQGLNLGETLEDGTTLNKYSAALAKVGIDIKYTNGEMKDMNTILDEMGAKWNTLAKDQQTALAQTVAGVRQYTQLVALMNNWDFFKENVKTAETATGALQKQADIYAESWEASSKRVKAAAEGIYEKLIDEDFFIGVNDVLEGTLTQVGNLIDGLGGLPGVLTIVSNLMLKAFGKDISAAISRAAYNIKLTSAEGRKEIQELRKTASKQMAEMAVDNGTREGSAVADVYSKQHQIQDILINKTEELSASRKELTESESRLVQSLMDTTKALGDAYIQQMKNIDATELQDEMLMKQINRQIKSSKGSEKDKEAAIEATTEIKKLQNLQKTYTQIEQSVNKYGKTVEKVFTKGDITTQEEALKSLKQYFNELEQAIEGTSYQTQELQDIIDAIKNAKIDTIADVFADISLSQEDFGGKVLADFDTQLNKLKGHVDEKTLEQIEKAFQNTESESAKAIQLWMNYMNQVAETEGVIQGFQGTVYTAGDSLVAMAEGISAITAGINALKGIGDIWSNEDLTYGEKILSTITTLASVIPILVSSYQAWNAVKLTGIKNDIAQAAINQGLITQQGIKNGQQAINNGLLTKEIALETILNALRKAKLGHLLAIVAIMGVIIGLGKVLYDNYNKEAIAAEKAEKAAENLKRAYTDTKAAYEEMISAMDDYQSARDGLEELTRGTQEYKEALNEANKAALALIETAGLVRGEDYEITNGEIIINDKAMNEARQVGFEKTQGAYSASIMADAQAAQARAEANEVNFSRSDNRSIVDGIIQGITVGLGSGLVTGNIAATIALAIGGAVSGAIATPLGNYFGDEAQQEQIDTLVERYKEIGEAAFEATELQALGFDTANQDYINSLKEVVRNTHQAAEQLETASELAAAAILDTEEKFINSKDADEIYAASGDVYQKLYEQALKTYSSTNMTDLGLATQEGKNLWNEYLKIADLGKNATATNFTSDSIKYKYQDENNQWQKAEVDLETMAAALATAQANELLAGSAEKLLVMFSELDKSAGIAAEGLKSIIAYDSLENASRIEAEELKDAWQNLDVAGQYKYLHEQFGGENGQLDPDELTALGYNSIVDFWKAVEQAIEENDAAWADIGSDLVGSVKTSFANALSSGVFDDLSLSQTQEMADMYQEVFNKVGSAGVDALTDTLETMFDDAGEEADEMAQILSGVDWQTTNVKELSEMLEAAGIETKGFEDELARLIGLMREGQNIGFDAATEQYSTLQEMAGLKKGDTITAEEAAILEAAGIDISQYFEIMANGFYELRNDVEEFYRIINENSLETFKSNINALYQEVGAGVGLLYRRNEETIAGENYSAGKGYNQELVADQLTFLEALNVDFENLDAYQRTVAEGGNLSREVLNEIQQLVEENKSRWDELPESIQSSYVELQKHQEAIANSAQSVDKLNRLYEDGYIEFEQYQKAVDNAMENEFKMEGLDPEAAFEVAEAFREMNEAGVEGTECFEDNEEAVKDATVRYMELNEAIADIYDNYDDYVDILKTARKATNELDKASIASDKNYKNLQKSLAGLIGISEDFIDVDFVSAINPKDFEAAANGSTAAIERIRDAFIQTQIEANNCSFSFDDLKSELDALNDGAYLDLNTDSFVYKLIQAAMDAGKTASEIEAMLSGIGIDADVSAFSGSMAEMEAIAAQAGSNVVQSTSFSQNVETEQVETPQTVTNYSFQERVSAVPRSYTNYVTLGNGLLTIPTTSTVWEYSKSVTPTPVTETTNDSETAISVETTNGAGESGNVSGIQVKGAHKAPTASKAPSVGNTSRPPVSSGKGGGGGSKEKEPSKPKKIDTTKESEVVERYKEINDQLDDLSDEYEKASRAADRLWGEHRLDAIREQNELIKEQQELLAEKQKQAENYMKQDQIALQQAAAQAGLSFSFDENGNISNYTDQMTNLYNQLAAAEAHYNSLATGEDQEAYEETILEPLKDKIKAVEDAIEIYEESKELFEELGLDIEDLQDQIMQNNYDIIMEGLELHISFNEEDLENIDYYLSKLEDDFYSMAEAAALMVGANDNSQLNEYLSNLEEYSKVMDDLHKAYANGKITEAAYQEGLKEIRSNIRDNLSSLLELDKAMMEYYGETLAMAQEELAKYTNRMQQQTEVLQHYGNMMEILGKQLDYNSMGVILQGQVDTIENEMNVAEAAYNMYKQQAEEKRALYEEAMENNDLAAAELYKKEWEAAQEAADEAQSEMLSKTEEWAEAMRAVVENKLAGLAKSLEEALTGGTSFDQINLQLERAVSLQEEYLTTTNQIYETNKLMRTAQQAIDKSTNSVAKQRLKDFIKETDQLQDKAKLSQYELEIQQAKYNLLLAEIALEDAQNAKSTVRLQRDSEGNFGYVYTADQTQLAQAQQELEDAQNSLYNIGLEGAGNYTEKYTQTMQEMYDILTSITEAYYNGEITSQEDYEAQMLAAQEYYYQQLENYQDLYGIALQTDTRVIQDSWTSSFRTMINNTENWKIKVNDYSIAAGQSLVNWYSKVEEISQKTGLDNIANNVKKVTDESKALRDIVLGTDGEPGVINALQQELKEVSDLTRQYATFRTTLQGVITEYEKLINAANRLAEANARAGVNNSSNNSGSSSSNNSSNYSSSNSNNASSSNNTNDLSSSGESNSSSGRTQTANKYKATYNLRGRSNTISGYYSEDAARAAAESAINSAISALTGITFSEKNDIAAAARRSIQIARYNTGGYTGSWGPYGKLGILDEKELILNPEDTENFLASMKVLERILEIIDLQAVNSQLGGTLLTPSIGNSITSQSLEQSVHIEASFPGVQDRNEIEEAFNTLINKASQYANRK